LATELVDNSECFGSLLVPALILQSCVNSVVLKEGSGEFHGFTCLQVFPLESETETIADNTESGGGAQSFHAQTWTSVRLHHNRYTTHHRISDPYGSYF